jgi:aminoglycoside phosphotransferase (APT) family kinase protein
VETIRADLERELGRRVESIDPIPEGHSGFTYWVVVEGERLVMRLPPPGARIAGPADIPRQGRIMDALSRQGLPVPGVRSMSSEPVIDGRPYVLVEAVDGVRIELTAGHFPNEVIAGSAVDTLKRLQAVPLERTGIADEQPQELAAELARWTWLMDRAPEELTGEAPGLVSLLESRMPAPKQPVLVHADFHYGNMLFREGRLVALLDWEIAQLGQPLLDLACLFVVAQSARTGKDRVPGGGSIDVPDDWLLACYGSARSEEFAWYLALTYYKYAAIFGYNLMLHRRGKRPDPIYEERTSTILDFIEEGVKLMA